MPYYLAAGRCKRSFTCFVKTQENRISRSFESLRHQTLTHQSLLNSSTRGPNPVQNCSDDIEPSNSSLKPLWIVGSHRDTLRFLVQWLSASLAKVPLLVLQPSHCVAPSDVSGQDNLAIHAICAEADKHSWTTSDLLAIISRECFNHNNESIEDCARRILYVYA